MSLDPTQLKLFEIINPGGLPEGLTKKAFGKISLRRNELIADLFFRLHKVERTGMGIKKMREITKAAGISSRKIEENLAKLKDKELLQRIGPDKGGYWEVLE